MLNSYLSFGCITSFNNLIDFIHTSVIAQKPQKINLWFLCFRVFKQQ